MHKKAKSVQKRPTYSLTYNEIDLPARFPIVCSELFVQTDTPITFLHWHNTVEIGYCHKGSGIFIVGDQVLTFAPGDLICIAANDVHLAQSSKGTKSTWTWLYLEIHDLFIPFFADASVAQVGGAIRSGMFFGRTDQAITQTALRIIDEFKLQKPGFENLVRCRMYDLLISMQRKRSSSTASLQKRGKARSLSSANIERIKPAIEHICNQYHEEIGVGQLAGECFMSETNFRRFFYKVMGKTPLEYIQSLRISIAASQLAAKPDAIGSIALECGFNTISSFNRTFKSIMNVSPRQWRKNQKATD